MESLPYDLSHSLDFPSWNETKTLNDKVPLTSESAVRYGDTADLDLGYQSLRRRSIQSSRIDWSLENSSSDQYEMQMKVDFFRKLGYTSEEIDTVLQNTGVEADVNTVLGELVKHGGNPEKEALSKETSDAALVPRGGPDIGPATSSTEDNDCNNLRPIVIDGSNVAMSHGNKDVFSCRGILIAVNFFLERGHTDVTVFVPSFRKEQPRSDMPITDQHILTDLEKKKILVFTPSRRVGGKRLVCYDDRFIVKLAYKCNGIIVSNDTYRDLQSEKPEWKKFIEERLLMYSFVNDLFMPPDDPMGRKGPNLDDFLRKRPIGMENKKVQCPYGKKCTYGMKCKFYHPERINQTQRSVADELRENARFSHKKGTSSLDDKKTRKVSASEISAVEPDHSMQKHSLERSGSSQKARTSDKSKLKHWNGPPERYSQGGCPKDSHNQNSYDSGLELWASFQNCLCDLSHDYSNPQISCCHHRNDPNNDPHQHYSSQKLISHSSSSYYPYGPSSWTSQNASQQLYRREIAERSQVTPQSLPTPYARLPTHSLEYWSDPGHNFHPSSEPHSSYQLYSSVPSSNHDYQPWPNYTRERLNLRTRLCAIFHPSLVDSVMNMFPHLKDAESIAAEIVNYRSQNGL